MGLYLEINIWLTFHHHFLSTYFLIASIIIYNRLSIRIVALNHYSTFIRVGDFQKLCWQDEVGCRFFFSKHLINVFKNVNRGPSGMKMWSKSSKILSTWFLNGPFSTSGKLSCIWKYLKKNILSGIRSVLLRKEYQN